MELLTNKNILLRDSYMKICELIRSKDYDYIEYRMNTPTLDRDDIFIGCARSENGKLISLDGDYYSKHQEIIKYEEWSDEEEKIKNGLTVWI